MIIIRLYLLNIPITLISSPVEAVLHNPIYHDHDINRRITISLISYHKKCQLAVHSVTLQASLFQSGKLIDFCACSTQLIKSLNTTFPRAKKADAKVIFDA
jgi:hypothetical protein